MQPDTAAVEIWSQNKLKISDLLAEQKWIQGLEKQKLKKNWIKLHFLNHDEDQTKNENLWH